MIVIPNGFDLPDTTNDTPLGRKLRVDLGWSNDEVVVGFVGRFNPVKDQANFIRAAGILAKRFASVRFLMVGRGLDLGNSEFVEWLEETGYASRFGFLGERADVQTCFSAMDLFCLSSTSEGFPNVVGEAMATGLPCVVTDVGDAAVLVGDTGIVVPKENPAELAEGIARLVMMTPEARLSFGLRARERIAAEYSITRVRERFEAIYTCIGNDLYAA
jgi:glycosyltransferase involved in cell wall biosynthesis